MKVLHCGRKVKVKGKVLVPWVQIWQTTMPAQDDQLAARSYQHAARIARSDCGRKGRLHAGSTVKNTVGYHERWKLGLYSTTRRIHISKLTVKTAMSRRIEESIISFQYYDIKSQHILESFVLFGYYDMIIITSFGDSTIVQYQRVVHFLTAYFVPPLPGLLNSAEHARCVL